MIMNTFTLFPKALIYATFLLLSCKEEVDLTPKDSLICAPVGLAENHPHNKDYQDILDNYLPSGFPGFLQPSIRRMRGCGQGHLVWQISVRVWP